MTRSEIRQRRRHNQRLAGDRFDTPEQAVAWFGALQAQDYAAAKWALGLRMRNASDAALDEAFAAGTILRTHVMRPTWHFVTPADIRWLLALTAPRVNAASASYLRRLELDEATFARSHAVLIKALEGGQRKTRPELAAALVQAGIVSADLLRVTYLIMRAELDGIVCSGARRGKQFTYALLDERVPPTPPLARDEALAQLARRYFRAHGPATLKDYVWWSGLSAADAKAGLDAVKAQLIGEAIEGQTYWFADSAPSTPERASLLPNYDEYIVGYTDRSAIFDPRQPHTLDARGNVLFNHTLLIDGQIVGTWRRAFQKSTVLLEMTLFRALSAGEDRALDEAAQRYGNFLGMAVVRG